MSNSWEIGSRDAAKFGNNANRFEKSQSGEVPPDSSRSHYTQSNDFEGDSARKGITPSTCRASRYTQHISFLSKHSPKTVACEPVLQAVFKIRPVFRRTHFFRQRCSCYVIQRPLGGALQFERDSRAWGALCMKQSGA